MNIKIKRLTSTATLPTCDLGQTGGWNLYADLTAQYAETGRAYIVIAAGDRAVVRTGLALALPPGWYLQLRSCPQLAMQSGLLVVDSFDTNGRDELGVLLLNLGRVPCRIGAGERIAQAVFVRHETPLLEEDDGGEIGRAFPEPRNIGNSNPYASGAPTRA